MVGNTQKKLPRFLIVQVITKRDNFDLVGLDLAETKQLIDTVGGVVVGELLQRRDHPEPNFYLGAGKIEELKRLVESEKIDVVVINGQVKSSQLFRIEKELWDISTKIMVWDRIDLILNIFDQHAVTTEAKLQIKLAKATHMGPRIYGLGKTELSRQGGGVGTRGKGETNIEFEKRKIKVDQQKIKKELKKLLEQKHERLRKRNEIGIGPVALVGYTSAGKTTLFNALTGKEKEMSRGLFTTLDTVVGKIKTSKLDQPVLVSDTIGFINQLPPVLIEAFKSTLLESLEAKLLLHVVDANDPRILEKIKVVDEILLELGATQPIILVLNKADLLNKQKIQQINDQIERYYAQENQEELKANLRSFIFVSSVKNINLTSLKDDIVSFFEEKK